MSEPFFRTGDRVTGLTNGIILGEVLKTLYNNLTGKHEMIVRIIEHENPSCEGYMQTVIGNLNTQFKLVDTPVEEISITFNGTDTEASFKRDGKTLVVAKVKRELDKQSHNLIECQIALGKLFESIARNGMGHLI